MAEPHAKSGAGSAADVVQAAFVVVKGVPPTCPGRGRYSAVTPLRDVTPPPLDLLLRNGAFPLLLGVRLHLVEAFGRDRGNLLVL